MFRTIKNTVLRPFVVSVSFSLLFPVACIRAQDNGAVSTFLPTVTETVSVEESPLFRVEKKSLDVGADLITIFVRRPNVNNEKAGPVPDVPLISVLKDTLGDLNPDNDKLRYVWLHSYSRPSIGQRAAAFVPFLYIGSSKRNVSNGPPPPVIDLQSSNKAIWHKLFWYLFRRMVVNELSITPKASAMQYHQNRVNYERSAVADLTAALALFQAVEHEQVLTDSELRDIQARLALTEKAFGWKMQSENLNRVYEEEQKVTRDYRGHNWELLRQYAEAQGLYFDPLMTDDGIARHAILWTSVSDVKLNQGKSFNRRFLNIKSPWDDKRLLEWKGYTQVRWFNADDRQVEAETPGAVAKTMIPLALYGLDHPKVPMILVDFRDAGNPKFRELSRRILVDVADNVLSLSQFHSIPYFVGRMTYEFVTGRRGIDLNQASRFRSYSQLRLLLALDDSLDPDLKREVSRHVNSASINPMGNNVEAETQIAAKQYGNLMAFAGRSDGLAKTISDDRREEMVPLKHSGFGRAFFTAANVFSLGLYTHREEQSPELMARLDMRRQLQLHERFLREVAFNSAGPEIDTDLTRLREALDFVAVNGDDAEVKTTRALARIYAVSRSEDLRLLCLTGLYKIDSSSAKKELLAIYKASRPTDKNHEISARYLKQALAEGKRISSRDIASITAIGDLSAN